MKKLVSVLSLLAALTAFTAPVFAVEVDCSAVADEKEKVVAESGAGSTSAPASDSKTAK